MTSYGMNAVLQPFVDDVKKLVSVLADVLLIHVGNSSNVNHHQHVLLAINYQPKLWWLTANHLH